MLPDSQPSILATSIDVQGSLTDAVDAYEAWTLWVGGVLLGVAGLILLVKVGGYVFKNN